ncbi:hypothetical protein ASPZODRAFT_1956323 [Penicilliopsis zonata CBS 506.65]|uniref:Uncharacterized protein n=1 Tax=Penicilliopsis zonata CBS 506.65 TaxID=1073090 RepID=A0A1L9SH31_9EURO|nr:hypothetical protein ASPZODRAFT_1956323 [Penicilliopsis zonata CBS 506.65]OJJ46374.1 hypothetical protein ASPZODRAFT_1956323 [Penicilliopsis zonata CBS 506.65]
MPEVASRPHLVLVITSLESCASVDSQRETRLPLTSFCNSTPYTEDSVIRSSFTVEHGTYLSSAVDPKSLGLP